MSRKRINPMNSSVPRRLRLLAIALILLAVLIGSSAFLSWRGIDDVRDRFFLNQTASFQIADHLQSEVLQLDSHLLTYRASRLPEDWRRFQEDSQRLHDWVAQQKVTLTTPKEKALLAEIQTTFDGYVAAAQTTDAPLLDQLAKVRAAEAQLISLGLQLAFAHREATHGPVAETERSLTRLQAMILAGQLTVVLLAAWTAVVTYREMIAPLRVELIESQALVVRNEKLASLGVLAAGVAHEIRNPLTAIKARLYVQQKALTPGSRERGDAEFIGREIDRLDKIVTDFLRFARPVEPERRPLSPADLLRAVCELMAPKLRESGMELAIDRAVETAIDADPEQLEQVLLNLINNAADALGDHGTIKLRAVESRATLDGRSHSVVILEVEDNGPGIPPEVQERLFDPFFTTKPSGTGLGLSIAARIVEKHSGVLRFQTAANRGTTFGIVLPVES
jgi:signal transduction histidine kinase